MIKVTPPKRRYWLRLFLFGLALIIVMALLFIGYVIHLQINVFTTPHRSLVDLEPPIDTPLPYQEISLTTTDNLTLSGWYIPGTRAQGIVLVHGINTNRAVMLPEAEILAEAGFHLLLIDLRGHGKSEGSQLSYGYREAWDVQAGVDYLYQLPDVERVGVLGISLGGAAVVRATALDSRIEALVIESSFSSLTEAAEDAFDKFSIFPKWPFAPLFINMAEQRVGVELSQVDSARDLHTMSPRPVLIIHGRDDKLFPRYHAEKLYEAAQEPKELWLIEYIGHDNPVVGREAAYKERVVSFFDQALGD